MHGQVLKKAGNQPQITVICDAINQLISLTLPDASKKQK